MYQLHNSVPVAYMGKVRMKMSEIKFSDGMLKKGMTFQMPEDSEVEV